MTGLYRTDTQAADELLQLLFPDLTPDNLRTDGGNVNMPKVRSLLRERAELEASRLPLVGALKQPEVVNPMAEWPWVTSALAGAAPSVTAVFGGSEPKGPCTVCGTPREKHGSYPTCATHPYTSDGNCQTVLGATCVGAECVNGCVRARGASPATGGNVIGRQRDALCMVLDIAQRRLLLPAEAAHVEALLAESDDPHRAEREAYDRSMGAFFLADGSPRPDCASPAPSDAAVQPREGFSVCPRHDFDIVENPKIGCPKCNAERAVTSPLPTAPAGLFERHTKAVEEFLQELYAIMVDPCAVGSITVAEMKDALIKSALKSREDALETQLRAALAAAPLDRIARLLTEAEIEAVVSKVTLWSFRYEAIQLKFAEVNGITLAPIAGKGDGNG